LVSACPCDGGIGNVLISASEAIQDTLIEASELLPTLKDEQGTISKPKAATAGIALLLFPI
jgi:hypothetical protein